MGIIFFFFNANQKIAQISNKVEATKLHSHLSKQKNKKKIKKGKKNCVSLGVRVFISLLGLNNKLSTQKKNTCTLTKNGKL